MEERQDLISRQAAIDVLDAYQVMVENGEEKPYAWARLRMSELPSAQPEYEPVKAEDFAKTMSENTFYGFMVWHSEVLELMEKQGFVICKKTL